MINCYTALFRLYDACHLVFSLFLVMMYYLRIDFEGC